MDNDHAASRQRRGTAYSIAFYVALLGGVAYGVYLLWPPLAGLVIIWTLLSLRGMRRLLAGQHDAASYY